ncbi:aspartate/glutamate racemase family protein [Paucibacter sp. APW11]|uniref:Aspartate/glutamate racemase family protein n=1 Tax=Roseateles aquae TaxID=3077235 RepID=A0ABU3PBQ3_9BURK|nr:aspartate/glutamate racemase family protein [Paucibacter sp. APW11]MDT8999994.1 aspartate/glutamate racemase family protein [Paucibacter sp. APW11]
MKAIGLIGGMSWESTALYYQIINREVARRLGGLNSAPLHLHSLNFEQVAERQRAGAWDELAELLAGAGRALQDGGADCVLIGTNTMHKVAPEVQARLDVPLLHIADATAAAIQAAGVRRVALLGTRYTMEQPFYREHLARHGIECLTPDEAGRAEVHRIIFEELCQGHCLARSRAVLQALIAELQQQGAEGVILGCTELPLLLQPEDVALPLFDTTRLHALAAVDFALGAALQ